MKKLSAALAASLTLLLVACGGGSTTSTSSTTTTTETPAATETPSAPAETPATTEAPAATAPAETTTTAAAPTSTADQVVVKMGSDTGQLVFVPAKFTVKPGQKIVWLMNKAGPHNAVFDPGSPDAATAKAMAEPKLLNKPGDSVTVTVPANAVPGDYSFNCVPHKSAGMVGVITVAK